MATLTAYDQAVRDLEKTLDRAVAAHAHAPILDTLPACGTVLAGRMLAEFGADCAMFPTPPPAAPTSGASPVTRASGKSRVVVRCTGNRRVVDACRTGRSPPSSAPPAPAPTTTAAVPSGDGHETALRNLANKLIGQLDHCLRHRVPWDETTVWSSAVDAAAA